MTSRGDRHGRRARPVGRRGADRPRNAGRRLVVLVAIAALVVLSVASTQFAGGDPAASPSVSPAASAAP